MTGRRMQWGIVDLAAPTMLLPEETTPTQAAVDTETRTTRTGETLMPTILAPEYKSTTTRLILIRTRIRAGVSRKNDAKVNRDIGSSGDRIIGVGGICDGLKWLLGSIPCDD